jgi:hypothetical protein
MQIMSKNHFLAYLPEEIIGELEKYGAMYGTQSISSSVVEILKKYFSEHSHDVSNAPKSVSDFREVPLKASSASFYDTDDEPCEVMTSFLEP